MNKRGLASSALVWISISMSACASLDAVVSAPVVSLRNVQVEDIGFRGQTFLLSFDISNPNAFPLPISDVGYVVKLDGHRFASGEAKCAVTVPAGGDGEIAISVKLDLLKTAPELLFIVRDASREDISYALEGRFGIDIPYTRPLRFKRSGLVRMQASGD